MISTTIRADKEDRDGAAAVAACYGFDLSSVTRAFWKQIRRTGSIPLTLSPEAPNAETLAALAEADQMIRTGELGPGFDTGVDAIASCLED